MALRTVYVIVRTNWEYNDGWYYPGSDTPMKGFANPSEAEAFRITLEQEARDELLSEKWTEEDGTFSWWSENLYTTFGNLSELSNLNEREIIEALRQNGLPEPPSQSLSGSEIHQPDYNRQWWDGSWWTSLWDAARTSGQCESVWQIFERVHFFESVAVEVE